MFKYDGESGQENTNNSQTNEIEKKTAGNNNLKCIQRDETKGNWNNTCDKTAVKDSKGKIQGYTCQC